MGFTYHAGQKVMTIKMESIKFDGGLVTAFHRVVRNYNTLGRR